MSDELWVMGLWERTFGDLDKSAEYETQQRICHGVTERTEGIGIEGE